MTEIRKSIAALIALIGTWGVTAASDGGINAVEWFGLLAVIGGTGAVWGIPNTPPPDDSERGATDLGFAAAVAVFAALAVYVLLDVTDKL